MLYHMHHSQEADDLLFWLDWSEKQRGPILELGCGTGRVLISLAEAGHRIFGLDRDPAMLDYLRNRIPESVKNSVILIRGDLRSYCLASRFPLILMPCNTYSTLILEDRRIALSRARLHLAPQGVFILSIPNPNLLLGLSEEGESENESSFINPITGNPVQVNSQWKVVGKRVQFHWHYDHLLPDGRVERNTISSRHYVQDVDGILKDFQDVGFDIIHTFGNFEQGSFDNNSPDLIIIARGK